MPRELELGLETLVAECPACHTQQGTGPCLFSGTLWVRLCQALDTVRGHSRSQCYRLSGKSLWPLTTFWKV